ncbi:MAG: hypothetical protein AAF581_04685 [Planctomycetota bacterium]
MKRTLVITIVLMQAALPILMAFPCLTGACGAAAPAVDSAAASCCAEAFAATVVTERSEEGRLEACCCSSSGKTCRCSHTPTPPYEQLPGDAPRVPANTSVCVLDSSDLADQNDAAIHAVRWSNAAEWRQATTSRQRLSLLCVSRI